MWPPLPVEIIAAARAWIGTPWVAGASLKFHGADCAGLVRGVWRDLSGVAIDAPPWDPAGLSWLDDIRLTAALSGFAAVDDPGPGDVAAWRVGRRVHLGIMSQRGVIHADSRMGVIESPPFGHRRLLAGWSFPPLP